MAERILYILANEPTGGVGTFVLDFTSHFDDRVIVDYLMYTDQRNTEFQKKIKTERNRIFYLPELRMKKYLDLKKKTDEFFKVHAQDYRIVHLTYAGIVNLCYPSAKKYGIPHRILHSVNTRLSDDPIKSRRNKLLCLGWEKLANHYIACSMDSAEYLFGKAKTQSGEVVLIHNAIDCSQYAFNEANRDDLRVKIDAEYKKVFLTAGRLENQKNIGFALQVFEKIHERDPHTMLVVAGDGPQREELQKKAEPLGSAVQFIGFTAQLHEWLNGADVLLFPSLYEGLPIAVVDAQNAGLPCLLSDTISPEIALCDLVEFESLQNSPEDWAEHALAMVLKERKGRIEEIEAAGYNIEKEAMRLEEFYLGL